MPRPARFVVPIAAGRERPPVRLLLALGLSGGCLAACASLNGNGHESASSAANKVEWVAVVNGAPPAPPPIPPMGDDASIRRILDEGKNRNLVMEHLTYISTKIGPRLTGSANAETANRWAAEQFKSWGLRLGGPAGDGLWKWGEIPVRFDRGPSTAKVVMPRTGTDEYRDLRDMEFTTLAWSAGTNGPVRAPVVRMPADEEEFARVESKLRGAWVLVPSRPPGSPRGVGGFAGGMSARQSFWAELRSGAPRAPEPAPVAAPPIPDDGVSGLWEGTAEGGPIPAGGTPFTIDIRQADDHTVTGTFGFPGYRTGPIKDGKFDPATGTLTFKWDGPGGENEYTMKLADGALRGERQVGEGQVMTFAAKTAPRTPASDKPETPPVPIEELVFHAGPAGYISASTDDRVRTGGIRGWRTMDPDKPPQDVEIMVRQSDYDFLNSKLADGWPIEVEANLDHRFTPGPIPVYNTIAEIPGTDRADEVVIVSAHLDSWNGPGSQGTTDNGTGSSVTLEAARLLAAAGVKPRRTIRFILWTGEEQGLLGSAEYVRQLRESGELDRVSAVFVDDGGTNYEGGLACTADMMPMLAAATAPVTTTFPDMPVNIRVVERAGGGIAGGSSDHASFLRAGVPGFFWDEVGRADYGHGWHTQHDRIDLAIPEYLVQSSTCAAVTAYNLACADTLLPRPPRPDPNQPERTPGERRRQRDGQQASGGN